MKKKIKYVCVATEMKLYLPQLKQLIPDLIILGLNTKWEGFITKYKLLHAYLSTPEIKDKDIVCFIDAYDVLPTKNLSALRKKYHHFKKANPKVKIIVGYDKADNAFHEYLCRVIFGTIDADRLNSGQFIGRAKDIREIVNYILTTTKQFQTDQIELTKYANQFKEHVYIDDKQEFFYVKSRPMQQVTLSSSITSETANACAFIHANGNGFLDEFLKTEHGMQLTIKERYKNYLDNLLGCLRKLVIYDIIYIKRNLQEIRETLRINWQAKQPSPVFLYLSNINGLFDKLLHFFHFYCRNDLFLQCHQ